MLATAATAALAALTPVVVHDSAERFPLRSVAPHSSPAVYGRAVPVRGGGAWLQYWLFYGYQDQDRGIVRTGRHAADWELVQYRVDPGGRPLEAVYAQHSGAERCGIDAVSLRGGHPVVYSAHGSHASYLRAGTRDRLWPDPNDEADGRGVVTVPALVEITRSTPAWMRDPRPWGASRARWWMPMEQTSPRGPAFQPDRYDDPAAFAAAAHPCRADCDHVGECDGREKALSAGLVAVPALGVLAWWRRRRRRA